MHQWHPSTEQRQWLEEIGSVEPGHIYLYTVGEQDPPGQGQPVLLLPEVPLFPLPLCSPQPLPREKRWTQVQRARSAHLPRLFRGCTQSLWAGLQPPPPPPGFPARLQLQDFHLHALNSSSQSDSHIDNMSGFVFWQIFKPWLINNPRLTVLFWKGINPLFFFFLLLRCLNKIKLL